MSLLKNVGTIGGLTAISRVFGFARDMLLARVLGAGLAADAFQLAFTLPNTFRRLFAEGAFSVAFVPMYSRALHREGGGEREAEKFAGDVLAVFVWVLVAFSAVAMMAMPAIMRRPWPRRLNSPDRSAPIATPASPSAINGDDSR